MEGKNMFDPTFVKHPSPYDLRNIPTPPPPPLPPIRKKRFTRLLRSALLIMALGAAIGLLLYAIPKIPPLTSTPQTAPPSTLQPTPTLDLQEALVSSDFNTFLRAFAIAMASKQYSLIQSFADRNNFQYIPLCASGIGSWNTTYDALVTGNLTAVLHYPQLTPQQEGYQGYTDHSAPIIGNIGATAVQYDVGTLSGNNVDGTTQANRDGTVFVFESITGSSWLWRGLTANNSC